MKNVEGKNRKIVMLTVTESCNLDCFYCYEKNKSNAKMDINVAKAAVKYEFENSDGFDELEFDLFGGEPTICKDFIKNLVVWTRLSNFSKPYIFYLQTNGTLIDSDFQKFLISNKEQVAVGLSLDGTPKTHNKNRSNSYSKIDVNFFLTNYLEQGVRLTVHPRTLSDLFNDITHLHSLGFEIIDATFAHGVNWQDTTSVEMLEEQLRLLCDFYLEHPEIKKCSIFDMHIGSILNNENRSRKMCGTGTSMVSIDVNGKRYPCQIFQPNTNCESLKLGKIEFEKIKDFSDKSCADCPLEPICPNCYGMNYLANGDMLKRDKKHCIVTKVRAKATMYLAAKEIERGIDKLSTIEKWQTITAINEINKHQNL